MNTQLKILALSSSGVDDSGYLEGALPNIKNILGNKPLQIAFIGFASVNNDYENYATMVR